MRILFPNSNWASNIGNPFFTLGAKALFAKAAPTIELIDTASNPAVPFALSGKAYDSAFVYANHIGELDGVMLCGPIFDKHFPKLYTPLLERAAAENKKVFFLTCGGMEYDSNEIELCRNVLKKFPPALLTTRDKETYQHYGDLCERSYNGICTAWFSPDAYPGYSTDSLTPYITVAYDFSKEPAPSVLEQALQGAAQLPNPKKGSKLLENLFFYMDRNGPETVGNHKIIRPQHRLIRHKSLLFRNPNSFISFTPYGYLNLYRNTSLTITDRLHAAVATLAYGNPAYLFLRSNRTRLLEAVGLPYEAGKRMKIDMSDLMVRKSNYVAWLQQAMSTL